MTSSSNNISFHMERFIPLVKQVSYHFGETHENGTVLRNQKGFENGIHTTKHKSTFLPKTLNEIRRVRSLFWIRDSCVPCLPFGGKYYHEASFDSFQEKM